jgi:hypothetical protein
VFCRRWLGSVVFLVLGSAVGLRLMGLSLVVFALSLVSLVVFTLRLLSLTVFALGLLSLMVFALGLLSLMVLALGLLSLMVFAGLDLGRIVRMSVIDRVALALIMTSLFLMGALRVCRLDMPRVCRRFLLG